MKNRYNVGSGLWLHVLTFFLGISIVLRCSPELVYKRTGLEYMVICVWSLLSLHRFRCNLGLAWFEFLILLYPLFFLTGRELSKYMFFALVGTYYYFRIQSDHEAFHVVRFPVIIFGTVTALVTWFSYFFPTRYVQNVLSLFENERELAYQFNRRNMYMGFTSHYSRNAFYILIAAQLLFAEYMCGEHKFGRSRRILFAFLCVTEFLVAKRGPLLYLLCSLLLAVVLKQEGIDRKIKYLLKYAGLILILGALAIVFIPGADNIVVRIIASAETGDITTGRFELYWIGIRMFLEHPFFGAGWDGFRLRMSDTTFQGVHNDYIQLLGELGIFGFLVVLGGNLGIWICTMKAFRYFNDSGQERKKERIFLSFSLMYQIFVWLDSITGLPHFSYEIYTLYLMAGGYGVGLYRIAVREREAIELEGMSEQKEEYIAGRTETKRIL